MPKPKLRWLSFLKNLDKSTLIVIEYNSAVLAVNQMLHEKMKAYPFNYVIIKPEELASYSSKKGYYILRGPSTMVDLGPDAEDFQYGSDQVLHVELMGQTISGASSPMRIPRYYFSLLDFSKGKGYFFRSNFKMKKVKGEIILPFVLDQIIKKLKKKGRNKG